MKLTLSLLAAVFFSTPAQAGAAVTVTNYSSWNIHSLYLSPSTSPEWGADQLGAYILSTGTQLTLTGITCDLYDVKIVDEDGDQCDIAQVPMCEDHASWVIDDTALLSCQAATY